MSDTHTHEGPSPFVIFGALLVLTGITVGVSYVDFGRVGGVVVAMAIASLKATLVLLYFMHVKFEVKRIYIIIGVPLVLTIILILGLSPDVAFSR